MSFKYLVAIDFECTCFLPNAEDNNRIIEFAAAVISLQNGQILYQFREFVRQNVVLNPMCTQFTGVTQADISGANSLNQVLVNFDAWLKRNQVHPSINRESAFATWSENDLNVNLPRNCQQQGIPRPSYFNRWIDLLRYTERTNLENAVARFGLEFIGSPHRALDDAKNTARLGYEMNRRQTLAITSTYP